MRLPMVPTPMKACLLGSAGLIFTSSNQYTAAQAGSDV